MDNKNNQKNQGKEFEAAAFTAGGAAIGAATSATLGGMGLAVAGTAFGIGMFPVTIAGGIIGLAAFGAKEAFGDDEES